jgi:hypothetical protein
MFGCIIHPEREFCRDQVFEGSADAFENRNGLRFRSFE